MRKAVFAAGLFPAILAATVLLAAPAPYVPPVTRDDGKDISIWFGRVLPSGRWCADTEAAMKRLADRQILKPGDFGWARHDGRRLQSVTVIAESEDSYTEDQYIVGQNNTVTRMVRTGHYINDPFASFSFEPDRGGRLRLTPASRQVQARMEAAGYNPYFVDWPHYSRLAQIPFAKLIDLSGGKVRVKMGC